MLGQVTGLPRGCMWCGKQVKGTGQGMGGWRVGQAFALCSVGNKEPPTLTAHPRFKSSSASATTNGESHEKSKSR